MAADYQSRLELNGSFVLSREALKQIAEVTSAFAGTPVTISIHLRGDDSISADDIDLLLSDTVLQSKPIDKMWFIKSSVVDKTWVRCDVSLYTSRHSKPVSIELRGTRDAVRSTREQLEEIFQGAKSALSPLARKTGIIGGLVLLVVSYVCVFVFFAFLSLSLRLDLKGVEWVLPFAAGLAVMGLGTLRLTMFPGLNFDFGASGKQLNALRSVRKFIFSVIIVGILVGVAGNFVYSHLSPPEPALKR